MQEALKNVEKHSMASDVILFLKRREERIEFLVSDNGRRFDLEKILHRTRPWIGFGLIGMKEKVEHSGGTFDVRPEENSGTTVRASWALKGRETTG
jgi:two-component system NarL family sensor kinase